MVLIFHLLLNNTGLKFFLLYVLTSIYRILKHNLIAFWNLDYLPPWHFQKVLISCCLNVCDSNSFQIKEILWHHRDFGGFCRLWNNCYGWSTVFAPWIYKQSLWTFREIIVSKPMHYFLKERTITILTILEKKMLVYYFKKMLI